MDRNSTQLLDVLWWTVLVRGIAAVAFGIAAIFWPGLTLIILVFLFSAYILVTGILNIVFATFSIGRGRYWILTLILGVVELGVGVYAIRHPGLSFITLILLIGFTLLARGIIELITALMEKPLDRKHRLLAAFGGVLAVIAGIFVLLQPAAGGLAFVWALGFYSLVMGAILIASSASLAAARDRETVSAKAA